MAKRRVPLGTGGAGQAQRKLEKKKQERLRQEELLGVRKPTPRRQGGRAAQKAR